MNDQGDLISSSDRVFFFFFANEFYRIDNSQTPRHGANYIHKQKCVNWYDAKYVYTRV